MNLAQQIRNFRLLVGARLLRRTGPNTYVGRWEHNHQRTKRFRWQSVTITRNPDGETIDAIDWVWQQQPLPANRIRRQAPRPGAIHA